MFSRGWKFSVGLLTMVPLMSRSPVHQPPPASDVAALVNAGVSRSTALAMERWKAREVLDLLRATARHDLRLEPRGPARGSI